MSRGQFVFHTTTPTGTYSVKNQVPRQTMTLTSYKIEMDDAASALAADLLRLEVPWISSLGFIDDSTTRTTMVLELDNAAVTLQTGLNRPVMMSQHIHDNFTYAIYDNDGNVVSTMVSLTLHFSFDTIKTS